MSTAFALCFGPYCLAGPQGPLRRHDAEIPLRPKTLEVLWYLVVHRGEVVEHERLLTSVWPNAVVGTGTLAVSIGELRRVLGDDPRTPTYIQTIHRRGYRFIAPVQPTAAPVSGFSVSGRPVVLGRVAELQQIEECYARVRRGERRLLFVTGEAGIGKSTLVDAWVESLGLREAIWLGRGQCVEHAGTGEPYLAILEALNRLCRGPRGKTVVAHLRQQAPGWLAQLSGVLAPSEREALQPHASPNALQYQRELADALESLSAAVPLVLVLEDLQWCDQATVEALAVLARRPERARVLMIGTYRPLDLLAAEHRLRTLKQELQWHGQAQELALQGLDEASVRAYVERHISAKNADMVASVVFQRTAGQPLFMVALTEYLAQSPALVSVDSDQAVARATAGLPNQLQQFIDAQVDRLTEPEQQILEAASVAGPVFTAAAVAAAVDWSVVDVERVCDKLARREHIVEARGLVEWPDGTLGESYAFRHALYQEVLYRRMGMGRRIRLHRAVGERLESGHGKEASTLAVDLAEHFELGQDDRRAVHYHFLAGEIALSRHAAQAALDHLRKGLALLSRWPQDAARIDVELKLQVALGAALSATEGFGARAVAVAYGRAHALSRQLEDALSQVPVLCGLWNYFLSRADLQPVQMLAQELAEILRRPNASGRLLPAHNAVGQTYLFMGEPARALEHIEAGPVAPDQHTRRQLVTRYGEDPVVVREMYAALACWLLGRPEQASRRLEDGLRLARELTQPFGIAQMLWTSMLIAQGLGDPAGTESRAEDLIALCEREQIALWLGGGHALRGWALAQRGRTVEGIDLIHRGCEVSEGSGLALIKPYYLGLLAEAYSKADRAGDGLATINQALEIAVRTGERWYEADLYRIRGALRLQRLSAAGREFESDLFKALALAAEQQALTLELRAALTLARVWAMNGREQDAYRLLLPIHGKLTEGFQTRDAAAATALLGELSGLLGAGADDLGEPVEVI